MKILATLFFCLTFVLAALAQIDLPIVGKISDIQGKKKVYISAETTKSREKIQKLLDKEKIFEIFSDAGQADFIIEFKPIEKTQPAKIGLGKFSEVAEINVYFYNADKKKVIAFSDTKDKYKDSGFGGVKDNEVLLIKSFLKAYKGK